MIQVTPPVEIIIKSLGEQKIINKSYRQLTYIHVCKENSGVLIYNLMTRECIFLSGDEERDYLECNLNSAIVQEMIKKWFLVPSHSDDFALFKQVDNIFRFVVDNKESSLTKFVIYPTTDCNARCFYCFELNCNRISMTEQTARDVAEFIIRKSNGKKVHLMWFGGEPLCNMKAIDIIVDILNKNGINYDSEMISNGYLFSQNIVSNAKNNWNLRKIQITLDGTEEIYNRCKAYVYKDVKSPFLRVLDNIELLLKSGIYVNIRLNMDMHNYEDLQILAQQLVERFGKFDNYLIYISLLFEKCGDKFIPRSYEDKIILYQKYYEIISFVRKHNKGNKYLLSRLRTSKHCMADSNDTTTILPDGRLGKCEHFTDSNFYGSIFNDNIDKTCIEYFKEIRDYGEKCHNCTLQPMCLPLKACPIKPDYCDEFEKEVKIKFLEERMRTTFSIFSRDNTVQRDIDQFQEFCD